MNPSRLRSLLLAAGGAIAGQAAGGVDLIMNGDFETGDAAGWVLSDPFPVLNVIADETIRTCCGATGVGDFPSGRFVFQFNGLQSDPVGQMWQNIETVSGVTYRVVFDFGKWSPTGVGGVTSLRLTVTDTEAASQLSAIDVVDTTGTNDLSIMLQPFELDFVAGGSITELRFADISQVTDSTDALLDNVSVIAIGGCNLGDLAVPFGVLDLADINAFTGGFLGMDPIADLNADGLFDLADVTLFVNSFTAGCL